MDQVKTVEEVLSWREIDARCKAGGVSVYDWCWVCGQRLRADKMHVLIDNGRVMRHTYACRRHRYVVVQVGGHEMVQERTDLEIESLASAFRSGQLQPGWE